MLVKQGRIKAEITELGTLFTVVNYSKYQRKEIKADRLEQQRNTNGTLTEHQRNNTKKGKKGNNVKKRTKNSLVKSFQDFTILTEDHQIFAEDFLRYTKTEHPTHYAGLVKRYKNEAECDISQMNSYLETLDLLLRKDKYRDRKSVV